MTRDEVLRRLARAETFCTVFEGVDGKMRFGAMILAQRHGGRGLGGDPLYFLRTVADGIRADNLGELPSF